MWRRSKGPVIGLAMSVRSVKAVAIEQIGTQFKLIAWGEAALAPQCLSTTEVKDSAALTRAIQTACSSLPKKSFRTITALSDDAVLCKTIPINALSSEEEIMAQAFVTASQAIASPAAELCCDYQIIPSSSPECFVSFAAARAQTIAAYHQAVSDAGFTLSVIDVESYILAQTYHYFVPKNVSLGIPSAILDIAQHRSLFVMVNKTTSIYARTETFVEEHLIKKISEVNSFIHAVSESQSGNFLQDCQNETMTLFFQALVQQLKRHLQFFVMSHPSEPIQQIFITGEYATLAGVSLFLSQETGLSVVQLNTLANVSLAAQHDSTQLLQQASSWLFPCALAIRGFNNEKF
jgi:type IV pilus assembly protein PilM